MEFNSQICTTEEQSKRLLALGLKKETADMILFKSSNLLQYPFDYTFNHDTSILNDVRYVPMVKGETPFIQDGNIPAWSLHRLLELFIEVNGNILDWEFEISPGTLIIRRSNRMMFVWSKNVYDSIITCIEWLIKSGYFNKEYLE